MLIFVIFWRARFITQRFTCSCPEFPDPFRFAVRSTVWEIRRFSKKGSGFVEFALGLREVCIIVEFGESFQGIPSSGLEAAGAMKRNSVRDTIFGNDKDEKIKKKTESRASFLASQFRAASA